MSVQPESKPCPICGKTNWIKNSTLSALLAIEQTFKVTKVATNNFIPVRAYVCVECNYVRLFREGI